MISFFIIIYICSDWPCVYVCVCVLLTQWLNKLLKARKQNWKKACYLCWLRLLCCSCYCCYESVTLWFISETRKFKQPIWIMNWMNELDGWRDEYMNEWMLNGKSLSLSLFFNIIIIINLKIIITMWSSWSWSRLALEHKICLIIVKYYFC